MIHSIFTKRSTIFLLLCYEQIRKSSDWKIPLSRRKYKIQNSKRKPWQKMIGSRSYSWVFCRHESRCKHIYASRERRCETETKNEVEKREEGEEGQRKEEMSSRNTDSVDAN